VNVSPDKRTILLHDQADLLENLKVSTSIFIRTNTDKVHQTSLTELFETHEQTVPVSQLGATKLPIYKQTSLFSSPASSPLRSHKGQFIRGHSSLSSPPGSPVRAPRTLPPPDIDDADLYAPGVQKVGERSKEAPKYNLSEGIYKLKNPTLPFKPPTRVERDVSFASSTTADEMSIDIEKYPEREGVMEEAIEPDIPSTQLPASPRPPQSRSQRRPDTQATITIGDRSPVLTGVDLREESPRKKRRIAAEPVTSDVPKLGGFAGAFSRFLAPGTQQSKVDIYQSIGSSVSMKDSVVTEASEDVDAPEDEADEGELEQTSEIDEETAPPTSPGEAEQDLGPGPETSESGDQPLFLPDAHLEHDSESEDKEEQEEGPSIEAAELASSAPEADCEDDEYVPEAEAEAERRVSARAARLLKEAEAFEVTHPVEQLLERNLRLLNDSRSVTTNRLARFERTSLEQIKKCARRMRESSALLSSRGSKNGASEDLLDSQNEAAEQRLSLTVTKEDFMNMKIHGQFNKGFILATRGDELFIIDQHASDEKFNFETLQATTVVQNQPLVVPRALDLMAMDEIAVMDNLGVLKRNGFVVDVDLEAPMGRRCKLISLPMSKETIFDIKGMFSACV
jgi:DNA mismatch repair protein PMS2